MSPPPDGSLPVAVEAFIDFHCPYSYRAVTWLDALGPELVDVRYRLFGLEQVNRDPTAEHWRLWDQPLDYEHYQERRDRRPLAAFLAAAVVDGTGDAALAIRYRRAVYEARFQDRLDISDPVLLEHLAVGVGAPARLVRDGLTAGHPAEIAARARIADDWRAARQDAEVFGVPTLRLGTDAPFYLRLARPVSDGAAFLSALLAFRAAAPEVLELKLPAPIERR